MTQILWGTRMSSIFHTRSQRALLVTNQVAQVGLQSGREKKDATSFISAGAFKGDGAHSQTPFGVQSPRKEWEGPKASGEVTEGCPIQCSKFRPLGRG